MARIRTIKPTFWTSEQVMDCSPNARLLFIGIWNFADDAGRMSLKPRTLKASVFPSDEFTATDILGMIRELSKTGLIDCYTVDEQDYLQVTGWHHQRIDKPQPSKIPGPPDDHSENDPRLFDYGMEGKGREGSSSSRARATVAEKPPAPDPDPAPATAAASAGKPEPMKPDPAIGAWLSRYSDRVAELWAIAPSPPKQAIETLKAWLSAGIDLETAWLTVSEVLARLRESGERQPGSMRYFDRPVRDRAEKPDPLDFPDFLRRANNDEAQQRGRLRLFVKTGDWLSDWGDQPTVEQAEAWLNNPDQEGNAA